MPVLIHQGYIGSYPPRLYTQIYNIGGWGFVLPGNSFGSCANVILRLGYFQRFVLRTGPRALPPSQCKKKSKQKRSSPQGLAISAKSMAMLVVRCLMVN